MAKKSIFNSSLGPYIRDFINEKQSQGYNYSNESKWLGKFDSYWAEHGFTFINLTLESLEDWTKKRDCEGKKCQASRISVVREFSRYLNGIGINSYFPPLGIHWNRPLIHVLCDEETAELFGQIDSYLLGKRQRNQVNIRMSKEYPVLFRLIYCCGLRISEACGLSVSQVDLDAGVLSVIHSKGDNDRLVYLSEDLRRLCVEYFDFLCRTYGTEQTWFFPGKDPESHISQGTVDTRFRNCWKRTSFAETCDVAPTVHTLRHTYVVKRVNLWMRQGIEMNVMMPYLSKYLGHCGMNETYYYYHYVQEAAHIIQEKDTLAKKVIPEVRRR